MEDDQEYCLRVAEMRALVEELLFGWRFSSSGRFVSDAAGPTLRAMGLSALPVMESVIRERVVSNLGHYDQERTLAERFVGLGSLLVTYFSIIHDTNEQERSVGFMRQLPRAVRIDAILAVGCVNEWLYQKDEPPATILDYLREIAQGEDSRLAEVARGRLRYTWKCPVD